MEGRLPSKISGILQAELAAAFRKSGLHLQCLNGGRRAVATKLGVKLQLNPAMCDIQAALEQFRQDRNTNSFAVALISSLAKRQHRHPLVNCSRTASLLLDKSRLSYLGTRSTTA